jgi:hypothetical protein
LIALVAAPARADSGNYWNPEQPDESMCQDATGNWVMCDSMGADGISSGTAPVMQSCVSSFGCQKCFLANGTYTPTCGNDVAGDGFCKCKEDPTQPSGCKLEGKCTFHP